MKKNTLIEIISSLFILLFIYAAVSKLIDYSKFKVQLGQSPMLTSFAGWIGWIIPFIEIGVSFLILSSRYRLYGLYFSFGLMVLFTAYIVAITKFSDFVPCACGGILQNMTWSQHLWFNIFFVFIALTGIILFPSPVKHPST